MVEQMHTIAEITAALKEADSQALAEWEMRLAGDERKGVVRALQTARKRLEREAQEIARVEQLYRFEQDLAQGGVVVGLDEVGRGPLAGPLTVGAVVLDPHADPILGLNDSKQVSERQRPLLAKEIEQRAKAYAVVHISPVDIDTFGIMVCLRRAFTTAIADIEAQGIKVDVVLLDGNPLGLDPREVNVVKGDARCASIAAASLIAKVARDALMVEYDAQYPGYDFASSKGYGSAAHRAAIQEKGLSPIHRASYCTNFFQPTLAFYESSK